MNRLRMEIEILGSIIIIIDFAHRNAPTVVQIVTKPNRSCVPKRPRDNLFNLRLCVPPFYRASRINLLPELSARPEPRQLGAPDGSKGNRPIKLPARDHILLNVVLSGRTVHVVPYTGPGQVYTRKCLLSTR